MGQRSLSVLSPVDVNDPLLALPLNPAPPADDDNSPRDSVVAFGAPLSRSSVLRNARWIVNYSIVIGGTMMGNVSIVNAWRVVNATWDVLTISSPFPVLTATLPLTIISYNVVGRVQHILCAVEPPNATGMPRAWLPSTVSMFRPVTLRLSLAMQCPTNPNVVEVIVIETSSPGQSIEIATEVKAVSTAGLYMSLLSSLTVGTSLGRIAAVRSVVSCSSDGAIEGLVPLTGVTNCDGDEETLMEGARGSVLGSLILWTAGCAVGVLLTCGYSRATSKSLLHSMEMLGMPSLCLPLVIATLTPTVFGVVVLVQSFCGADQGIAAVGIAMWLGVMAVLVVVAVMLPHQLILCAHSARSAPRRGTLHTMAAAVLHRQVRWRPRTAVSASPPCEASSPHHLRWDRAAAVVVLEYSKVWYLCVDCLVLTASSALGAASALGSSTTTCNGSAIALILIFLGQAVVCAAVQPFTTLFACVHTLVSLTLSTASLVCQVWFAYASQNDNMESEDLTALLAASAVCELSVTGISFLRILLDVAEGIGACRKHVLMISNRRSAKVVCEGIPSPLPLQSPDDALLSNLAIVDHNDDVIELRMPNITAVLVKPHASQPQAPQHPGSHEDILSLSIESFWQADGTVILDQHATCTTDATWDEIGYHSIISAAGDAVEHENDLLQLFSRVGRDRT